MAAMKIIAQSRRMLEMPRQFREDEEMIPGNAADLIRPSSTSRGNDDRDKKKDVDILNARVSSLGQGRGTPSPSKIQWMCKQFMPSPRRYRGENEPLIDIALLPEAVGQKRSRLEPISRSVKKRKGPTSTKKISASEEAQNLFCGPLDRTPEAFSPKEHFSPKSTKLRAKTPLLKSKNESHTGNTLKKKPIDEKLKDVPVAPSPLRSLPALRSQKPDADKTRDDEKPRRSKSTREERSKSKSTRFEKDSRRRGSNSSDTTYPVAESPSERRRKDRHADRSDRESSRRESRVESVRKDRSEEESPSSGRKKERRSRRSERDLSRERNAEKFEKDSRDNESSTEKRRRERRTERGTRDLSRERKTERYDRDVSRERRPERGGRDSLRDRREERTDRELPKERRAERATRDSSRERRTDRGTHDSSRERRTDRTTRDSSRERRTDRATRDSPRERRTDRATRDSPRERRTERATRDSSRERRDERVDRDFSRDRRMSKVEKSMRDKESSSERRVRERQPSRSERDLSRERRSDKYEKNAKDKESPFTRRRERRSERDSSRERRGKKSDVGVRDDESPPGRRERRIERSDRDLSGERRAEKSSKDMRDYDSPRRRKERRNSRTERDLSPERREDKSEKYTRGDENSKSVRGRADEKSKPKSTSNEKSEKKERVVSSRDAIRSKPAPVQVNGIDLRSKPANSVSQPPPLVSAPAPAVPLSKPAPAPLRSAAAPASVLTSRPKGIPRLVSKPMPNGNGAGPSRIEKPTVIPAKPKTMADYTKDYKKIQEKATKEWDLEKYDDYERLAIEATKTSFEWALCREREFRRQEKEMRSSVKKLETEVNNLRNHYNWITRKVAKNHITNLVSVKRTKGADTLRRIVNKSYLRLSMLSAMWNHGQNLTFQSMNGTLDRTSNAKPLEDGTINPEAVLTTHEVRSLRKIVHEYANVMEIFNRVVSDTGTGVQEPGTECTIQ